MISNVQSREVTDHVGGALVQAQLGELTGLVEIYRAFGGGWRVS